MSIFSRSRCKLLRLLKQEDGAVTVDWVVLTGLVIVLCLALATQMGSAYSTGIGVINEKMTPTQ